MAEAELKPNPKPMDKNINKPSRQEQNVYRDGRERRPNEQLEQPAPGTK